MRAAPALSVKIRVLGSAAGGGFPQWNCNCPNCKGYRAGTLQARARTQSSIAVGPAARLGAGERIARRAGATAVESGFAAGPRHPRHRHRRHRSGGWPGRSHHRALHAARIGPSLAHLVHRQHLRRSDPRQSGARRARVIFAAWTGAASMPTASAFAIDAVPGVRWRALPVASKPAPYSPNRESPMPGDNLALVIEDESSGRSGGVCAGFERHR